MRASRKVVPGTFSGGKVECGTFCLLDPLRKFAPGHGGCQFVHLLDLPTTIPVVAASEVPCLASEPRQEPPIPPNTELAEESSLN